MKIKPILYSTEMVQALLEDRKSQTRRTKGLNYINKNPDNWEIEYLDSIWAHGKDFEIKELKPTYEIGDILWVRETFTGIYQNDGKLKYHYKAPANWALDKALKIYWKPSIHMPKEAARLFLKVINVRVERLKDISKSDAISEGIAKSGNLYFDYWRYVEGLPREPFYREFEPKVSFMTLWCKINGVDSWSLNPWVWVIEFERVEKPENF